MMIATLILAASLTSQAPALPAGTTVQYDKFDDNTTIRLKLGEFTDDAGTHVLSAYAYHDGRGPAAVDEVVFHIFKYSPHWEYLKIHDVVMMCGDDRLELKSSYDSEVSTKSSTNPCHEFFSIYLSAEKLQAMLKKSADIEVKIGSHKPFPLGRKCRSQIDAFTKVVRSGAY
jgi:hypothetical protein